jgi:membrane protein DedA with SNARE-associated domain
VSAAILAGTTQGLGIALFLLSAVLGAMLGSAIGFRVGDRYSEARFEEKLAVTRASGTRHSSIPFVAGETSCSELDRLLEVRNP